MIIHLFDYKIGLPKTILSHPAFGSKSRGLKTRSYISNNMLPPHETITSWVDYVDLELLWGEVAFQ